MNHYSPITEIARIISGRDTRIFFFFKAKDGLQVLVRSRGLGDVYKSQVYISPRRDRLIDTASVGTALYADRRFSDRMAAMLTLSVSHRIPRASLLELPATGEAVEADLRQAVATGFRNASCGATSLSAEAKSDYALSRKFALGLRAGVGYTRLASSPHALEWNAAAVFSF